MAQYVVSPKVDSLSFLDQCTVICLKYITRYGTSELQSGKAKNAEAIRELCKVAAQEAAEFGDEYELMPLCVSAYALVDVLNRTSFDSLRLSECLNTLQSFLEQDAFGECADVFVRPPVESIGKVALLLHLIYKTCEVHGHAACGAVIDIGVRYLRKTIKDFVIEEGGWTAIGVRYSLNQGDISSSVVVVSQEDADDDSVSTPPELVEKPLMTESYIQAMEGVDFRKISSICGDGEFEMVDTTKKAVDCMQSFPKETASKTNSNEEEEEEPSLLGGYLPHISVVGVAAAAAITGFFVLRKNM